MTARHRESRSDPAPHQEGGGAADLSRLLAAYRPGFSLPGAFYHDGTVFDAERERFIGWHWILAGHASEIPTPGDYRTFEVAGYALIIVRDRTGGIRALQNVCRHRGARVCDQPKGSAKTLVCRYHGWSYHLDGSLAAWRHMAPEHDKAQFGLRRCGVALFNGLIFVSIDPERAPDFEALTSHVSSYWDRYELAACEVAVEETYVLNANWKLGIENNLECYHCLPSHPQYCSVNAFVRSDERVSDSAVVAFSDYKQAFEKRIAAEGRPVGASDLRTIDGQQCRAGTWPLSPGFGTGSQDGVAVAPLLGRVAGYDESATMGGFGFHSYLIAMCDHAVMITYVPQHAARTDVVAKWLVRKGAKPGVDYDPARLRWLWDETTKQDKDIIELNARGVATRGYVPGPYSQLETHVAGFLDRYIDLMRS